MKTTSCGSNEMSNLNTHQTTTHQSNWPTTHNGHSHPVKDTSAMNQTREESQFVTGSHCATSIKLEMNVTECTLPPIAWSLTGPLPVCGHETQVK